MFDVHIQQAYFMKALEYLEPTVGKDSSGSGDNCICIESTGNGSITMYTTNSIEFTSLEMVTATGATSQCKAPLVDFKRLKSIVATIPPTEIINLKESVNDLLINFGLKKTPIKIVGSLAGMISLPSNQFPQNTVTSIPKDLIKKALVNACAIIEDNDNSPIYNCIRIYTDNSNVEFSAVDVANNRTFTQSGLSTCNNPQQDILIEASKLKKSMKLFEDFNELEFVMDSNMIRVEATDPLPAANQKTKGMLCGVTYYCRRLSGVFPTNIKQNYYPVPNDFAEINIKDLMDSFARVKAIEDSGNANKASVELTNGDLIISASTAYGEVEDTVETVNKPGFVFGSVFKCNSVVDILKILDTDTVEINRMSNHPMNYIIKSTGQTDVMFTVPIMNSGSFNGKP